MKLTSGMLLVVHVPKTAGTSLRLALERYYGVNRVIRDYGPNAKATSQVVQEYLYSENKADKEALIQRVSESGAKVLVGHFHVAKYSPYFDPARILAFVREPMERACSEYLHRIKNKTYSGTFESFAQSNSKRNIQSRFLAGVSDQSFVGLTEQYPGSLRYLNALYGMKLKRLKRNVNRASGGAVLLSRLSDAEKSIFYEYNQDDMKLFEYHKNRFATLDIPPTKFEQMSGLLKSANLRGRNNKEI